MKTKASFGKIQFVAGVIAIENFGIERTALIRGIWRGEV